MINAKKLAQGLMNHDMTINIIAPKNPIKPILDMNPIDIKVKDININSHKSNAPPVELLQSVIDKNCLTIPVNSIVNMNV